MDGVVRDLRLDFCVVCGSYTSKEGCDSPKTKIQLSTDLDEKLYPSKNCRLFYHSLNRTNTIKLQECERLTFTGANSVAVVLVHYTNRGYDVTVCEAIMKFGKAGVKNMTAV
jgi:hypothetical protein